MFPKYFSTRALHVVGLHVAGHHDHRVGRAVPVLEPVLHVVEGGGVEVLHRADGGPGVGVSLGKDAGRDGLPGPSVGLVLPLPLLVLDHAALLVEPGLGDRARAGGPCGPTPSRARCRGPGWGRSGSSWSGPRLVVPFRSVPPMRSSTLNQSSLKCSLPLNIRCSKRWANPVLPGRSFFEPTWYQTLTATMGALWSSWTMRTRPFGSTKRWKAIFGVSMPGAAATGVDLAARAGGRGLGGGRRWGGEHEGGGEGDEGHGTRLADSALPCQPVRGRLPAPFGPEKSLALRHPHRGRNPTRIHRQSGGLGGPAGARPPRPLPGPGPHPRRLPGRGRRSPRPRPRRWPASSPARWCARARWGGSTTAPSTWPSRWASSPGVTDPVAKSARVAIEDLLGRPLGEGAHVYTSRLYLLDGVTEEEAGRIARALLANEVIERVAVQPYAAVEGVARPTSRCPRVAEHAAAPGRGGEPGAPRRRAPRRSRGSGCSRSRSTRCGRSATSTARPAPTRRAAPPAWAPTPPTSSSSAWPRPGRSTASTRSSTPPSPTGRTGKAPEEIRSLFKTFIRGHHRGGGPGHPGARGQELARLGLPRQRRRHRGHRRASTSSTRSRPTTARRRSTPTAAPSPASSA